MKKIATLGLAILSVSLMIYAGIVGLLNNYSIGPFFTFVGFCTAIGLSIDVTIHIKRWLQKNKLRKLVRHSKNNYTA
jgi:hypothetical protein